MQKHNIKVGSTYIVKVSGTLAKVRITREHDRGGWYGTNLATGREIRIRTAARLRSEVRLPRRQSQRTKHAGSSTDRVLNQEKTMPTFAIATDNNITAFTAAEQVPEGHDHFATEKEFAKLSSDWPINRFAEVWNGFAGVVPFDGLKPVKKFTDRKTAVNRIWKAIQALTPAPAQQAAPAAPKKAKATKQASRKDDATGAKGRATAARRRSCSN